MIVLKDGLVNHRGGRFGKSGRVWRRRLRRKGSSNASGRSRCRSVRSGWSSGGDRCFGGGLSHTAEFLYCGVGRGFNGGSIFLDGLSGSFDFLLVVLKDFGCFTNSVVGPVGVSFDFQDGVVSGFFGILPYLPEHVFKLRVVEKFCSFLDQISGRGVLSRERCQRQSGEDYKLPQIDGLHGDRGGS